MSHLIFQPPQGAWSMKSGVLAEKMQMIDSAWHNPHLSKLLEEQKTKNAPRQFAMFRPQMQVYIGDPERIRWRESLREDDEIVNLVPVVGPIVRNFTWWAWSGVEIRDNIVNASNDPLVHAHLLYINSPGGESSALPDVKLAIDYAHSKGIPVYGIIDGCADSLGYGIAAMCDKLYFINPEDEVGCIGTYWAFWGAKPGAEDDEGYTYVEIYDAESFDKNKESRDALNGDPTEALGMLAHSRQYLVDVVTSGRPNMTDDQLHGKTFRAADVIGTMVDGQGDMLTVSAEAIAAYNLPEMAERRKKCSSQVQPEATSSIIPEPIESSENSNQSQNNNQPKFIKMELNNLCSLLGVAALVVDEEKGSYIQASQLEAIEAQLSLLGNNLITAEADLKSAQERAEKAESRATSAEAKVEEQAKDIATAENRISELETENQTLSNAAGASATVEQPADNNDPDAHEEIPGKTRCVRDPSKSTLENAEAILQAYEKK